VHVGAVIPKGAPWPVSSSIGGGFFGTRWRRDWGHFSGASLSYIQSRLKKNEVTSVI
jgi:hypothetical protein